MTTPNYFPSGGGGASGDVPIEVYQRLASQATSEAELTQLIQQYRDQQAALTKIAKFVPSGWIQKDARHWLNPGDGTVYELQPTSTGALSWNQYTAAQTKAYLNGLGDGSGGGSSDALGWAQLSQSERQHADQLAFQYQQLGMNANDARRQALATLIANRNNAAGNVAQTSADVAKTAAQFAANPRDAVAELMYRNQVGGSTPFGDMTNKNFGEYGKALADKAASIFQPVSQDLNTARQYRDQPFPSDFTQQIQVPGLPGAAGVTSPPASPPAGPSSDVLTQLTDRLKAMSPEDQAAFRAWTTAGAGGGDQVKAFARGGRMHVSPGSIGGAPFGFANGGQIDFGNQARFGGDQPSSSEGGTNMNIHEPAVIMGIHSKRVYATIAEGGYPEQVKISPTTSGKKAQQAQEKAAKAMDGMMQGAKPMANGGTATATPDDFMAQLSQQLNRLGGAGGGTGQGGTSLPSLRFLAGAPASALANDPVLNDYTMAGYSALGIDPRTVEATIKQYTPTSTQNNFPRISFG